MLASVNNFPAFPVIAGVRFCHCLEWRGYAVSDDGIVWTAKRVGAHGRLGTEWRQMRPSCIQRGNYPTVQLRRQGRDRPLRVYVHKLVMLAFVGPRPHGMHTRHKDGNPQNNSADNLCYGTPTENGADAVAHGRHYRNNKGKLTDVQVRDIKQRLANGERQASIAMEFGVGAMTVSDINTGRTWAHIT